MRLFLNTCVGYFRDVLSKYHIFVIYFARCVYVFPFVLALFVHCKSFNRSLTFILYLEQICHYCYYHYQGDINIGVLFKKFSNYSALPIMFITCCCHVSELRECFKLKFCVKL